MTSRAILRARRRRSPRASRSPTPARPAPSRQPRSSGSSVSQRSPSWWCLWKDAQHLPQGRNKAEDRHVKIPRRSGQRRGISGTRHQCRTPGIRHDVLRIDRPGSGRRQLTNPGRLLARSVGGRWMAIRRMSRRRSVSVPPPSCFGRVSTAPVASWSEPRGRSPSRRVSSRGRSRASYVATWWPRRSSRCRIPPTGPTSRSGCVRRHRSSSRRLSLAGADRSAGGVGVHGGHPAGS